VFIPQEEAGISSPGVDDLVFSGMLNGFSDNDALDLSVQFDLPDFFGNCENLLNFDTQVTIRNYFSQLLNFVE
jgi:hypothetical protein